jgi:hypothetical protein
MRRTMPTRHSTDASQTAAPKAGRKRRFGAEHVMAVQGKVQLCTRVHICIVVVVPPSILACKMPMPRSLGQCEPSGGAAPPAAARGRYILWVKHAVKL